MGFTKDMELSHLHVTKGFSGHYGGHMLSSGTSKIDPKRHLETGEMLREQHHER